jgi:nicotinamidase-related amidase
VPTKSCLINRSQSALLIVDIQERLLPAIYERERVLANAVRLARGAGIFGLPVFVTEQYRKGLGATAPELAAAVSGFAPVEKLTFSACGAPDLLEALAARHAQHLIVCGIEAHVCVTQTVLDLLARNFVTFVVADAISSRTAENWRFGQDRMRDAGAILISTEMVLFELLGRAGTEEFKQILPLVK